MKSALHRFIDWVFLAPRWATFALVAIVALVVFTNILVYALSLIIWVLVLNGLYHVILAIRNFVAEFFAVVRDGLRASIFGERPS